MKTHLRWFVVLFFGSIVLCGAEPVGIWEVQTSFRINFVQAVSGFSLEHALPLETEFQIPLDFRLTVEPSEKRRSLHFTNDPCGNTIAVLAIGSCSTNDELSIQMGSKVLVCPRDFSQLPAKIKFLRNWPSEAAKWLKPSFCAESQDAAIGDVAAKIRSRNPDMRETIRRTVRTLEEIRERRQILDGVHNETALYALRYRCVCTGSANLTVALLRAAGIPARIVGGAPTRLISLATHYMVEAYLPKIGWYPIEPTLAQEPWPPEGQINWCIVAPEYETEEKAQWRSYIGGAVPYLTCNEISLARGTVNFRGTFDRGGDNRAVLIKAIDRKDSRWPALKQTAHQMWRTNYASLPTALTEDSLSWLLDRKSQ